MIEWLKYIMHPAAKQDSQIPRKQSTNFPHWKGTFSLPPAVLLYQPSTDRCSSHYPHENLHQSLKGDNFSEMHMATEDDALDTQLKNNIGPEMGGWKTIFLLGRHIFRGYVSFREGI